MMDSRCHIILGFDYSNDLRIIASTAPPNSPLVISLYGMKTPAISPVSKIVSMQAPVTAFVNSSINFTLSVRNHLKNALVVSTIDVDEMKSFRDETKIALNRLNVKTTFVDHLEKSLNLQAISDALSKSNEEIDVVFVYCKAKISANVADLIWDKTSAQKRPLIFGTKFFGTPTLPLFRNMIRNKGIKAFHTHQFSPEPFTGAQKDFKKRFMDKFWSPPMGISLLAFDAMNFIIKSGNDAIRQKSITTSSNDDQIRQALVQSGAKISLLGVSGVEFLPGLETRVKQVYIIRTDSNGFYQEK